MVSFGLVQSARQQQLGREPGLAFQPRFPGAGGGAHVQCHRPRQPRRVSFPMAHGAGRIQGRGIFWRCDARRRDRGSQRWQCRGVPRAVRGDCHAAGAALPGDHSNAQPRHDHVDGGFEAPAGGVESRGQQGLGVRPHRAQRPRCAGRSRHLQLHGDRAHPAGGVQFSMAHGAGGRGLFRRGDAQCSHRGRLRLR